MAHRPHRGRRSAAAAIALALIGGFLLTIGIGDRLEAAESGDWLRPRGDAGYRARDLAPGEADSLALTPTGGVLVTAVSPGSAADQAGLHRGDIVRAYGLSLVTDTASLTSAARRYRAGDTVRVSLVRDGAAMVLDLVPRAHPLLSPPGIDCEVTFFPAADGTRLRAVLYAPAGRAGARLPALLIAAGQATALPGAPTREAEHELEIAEQVAIGAAHAGIRVLRFDPRGAGESEGADARQVDFTTEVDDLRQAINFLRRRADIDPAAVFVWGHAERAAQVALLASSEDLAGIAVSASAGRSELEHRAAITRRQAELDGLPAAAVESLVSDEVALMAAVAAGATREELREHPNLGRLVNSAGRILDDRSVAYWRQRLAINMGEVYALVEEPVLVVHLSDDPHSLREDEEQIARIVTAAGNRQVATAAPAPGLLPGAFSSWVRRLLSGA
jgi:alpha/beta superfamily hydrolase